MKRILALDLGDKRVGVAVSDPLGITAQGLKTLLREDDDSLIAALKLIGEEKKVGECIVGLPILMNGDLGPRARMVQAWTEKFKQAVEFDVKTWDERLTTREAQKLLISQDLSRKKQKEKNDQIAAILLLQNYLDFIKTGDFDPLQEN